MLNRYVEYNGETYRVLCQEGTGAWLISCQQPSAPFFLADISVLKRTVLPLEETKTCQTPGQVKRQMLIQPLLDDERCVTDRRHRAALVKKIAEENGTTTKRVLRLYYRVLATGKLMKERVRPPLENSIYDWAIRTFYYSAKRLSLRAAFEMMLVQKYSDANGKLLPDAPTWSSFQHYFYSRNYHKEPRKIIAREGLTHYQRNCRPAFGSVSQWREAPGSFQMDATQADIYLVSSLDRNSVVGRPYIYMAVDTATQLIAGFCVTYEAGEQAMMAALENAACDKPAFCQKYGINIQPEQWPSRGLPSEVITDRGREFTGSRMEELCRRYGVELLVQPPFRPDRKGMVEKAFDLLQQRYKPLLRGKGVIEADAQERWAVDYRSQAVLTLEEFTQALIHCVVYLNSGRVLQNGKTPARLWLEAAPGLLEVPELELHVLTLPRETVKLSRKGFHLNALWYTPEKPDALSLGSTYTLAYNPEDLGAVFLVQDRGFLRIPLAFAQSCLEGLTKTEAESWRELERQARKCARTAETQARIQTVHGLLKIVKEAERRRLE